MRNDLTDITVIMDRSGSMESIRKDAEGGVNQFIEDQKKAAGEANFTLVQFDDQYEKVVDCKPIKDVLAQALVPRGWTALLDAVGKAVTETGERISRMAEKDRPGLVICVIVTDGQENSSKEYTRARIKEMIQHQTEVYNWQFIYLGANQDAFAEAGQMGILRGSSANYTPNNASAAYATASNTVSRCREVKTSGGIVTPKDTEFTEEERMNLTSP